MKKILVLSAAFWLCSALFAHPGKTDAKGCHTNKKTGQYHCHNSKVIAKKKTETKKTENKKQETKNQNKKEVKKNEKNN